MAVSAAVGCNSIFGRERILKQATEWFHPEAVDNLRQRLVVLPPGVDVPNLIQGRKAAKPGRIKLLINHRLLKYTGVRGLLTETLPELWTLRQDFEVHATNPSHVRLPRALTDTPWLRVEPLSREEYVHKLWESDVVVAPHRAAHWSMSTVEAICAETVPLMNSESFFPEMMEPLLEVLSAAERATVQPTALAILRNSDAKILFSCDGLRGNSGPHRRGADAPCSSLLASGVARRRAVDNS